MLTKARRAGCWTSGRGFPICYRGSERLAADRLAPGIAGRRGGHRRRNRTRGWRGASAAPSKGYSRTVPRTAKSHASWEGYCRRWPAKHRDATFSTAPKVRHRELGTEERLAAWPRCCDSRGRRRDYGCSRRAHVFHGARVAQQVANAEAS